MSRARVSPAFSAPLPRRPGRPRHDDPDAGRRQAIARLADAFRHDGYDGASLATLARATGLGKSSLYHYFPGGKVQMVHDVLDFTVATARRDVFAGAAAPGAPAARLRGLLDRLEAFYAQGTRACILGRLCASVEREQFREKLTDIFRAQIDAITALLIDGRVPRLIARARAEDAVISIQGALVLSSGTGDPAPFRRMMTRLRRDLLTAVNEAKR